MPIIPLKQTVTVKRAGERDDWGEPTGPESVFTLRCRIDEGSRLARANLVTQGQSTVSAGEVLEVTSILFDKYADIRYSDTLTYIDGGGRAVTAQPLKVTVIRGVSGKPILTEVIM